MLRYALVASNLSKLSGMFWRTDQNVFQLSVSGTVLILNALADLTFKTDSQVSGVAMGAPGRARTDQGMIAVALRRFRR